MLAAKYSLREPLIPGRFEGIQLVSSIDLLALLTYHQNCANAVLELQTDLTWIESHYQQYNATTWMVGCGACKLGWTPSYRLFGNQVPLWWEEFMTDTFKDLRNRPCAQIVEKGAEDAIQKFRRTYTRCSRCPSMIADGNREFVTLFTNKIEEVTAKVSPILFTNRLP